MAVTVEVEDLVQPEAQVPMVVQEVMAATAQQTMETLAYSVSSVAVAVAVVTMP